MKTRVSPVVAALAVIGEPDGRPPPSCYPHHPPAAARTVYTSQVQHFPRTYIGVVSYDVAWFDRRCKSGRMQRSTSS